MNDMVAYGSHTIHGGTPSHISQRPMRIHSFVLPIHEAGAAMLFCRVFAQLFDRLPTAPSF